MKYTKESPVSVIIPTYNRADKLSVSVGSVLRQTHRALEIIVVDDGSTDNTEQVLSSFDDDRLRYHRLNKNFGVSHARNVGVSLARYDIIAFHDSDDTWYPHKLERQLSYWNKHPEDVLVYCAYEARLSSGNTVKIPSDNRDPNTLKGNLFPHLLVHNTIGTPTILVSKSIFESSGGFDPNYPALEDWGFALSVSRLGSIGYVDEILLSITLNTGSISSSPSAYFKARCMMLSRHLDDIRTLGLFDLCANDILQRAEALHLIEPVKKMMMYYLTEKTLS